MKQVTRPSLTPVITRYLTKRQTRAIREEAAGTLNIKTSWETARRTKTMGRAVLLLQAAMGATARCMYCVDSHGGDIDHYRPKADFVAHAFDWLNMVLSCTDCGRHKSNSFPVDAVGSPLLVNPLNENPWDFLSLDPVTGNITAKFIPSIGLWSMKGEKTVEVLHLDRREAVSAGYARTVRHLDILVGRHMPAIAAAAIAPAQIVKELKDLDIHCLLEWCFGEEGRTYSNFHHLHTDHLPFWNNCAALL